MFANAMRASRVEDVLIRIVESMRAAQTAFKIHFVVGATVRAPVLEAFPKDPPKETALIGSFIIAIQLEITAIVLITFRSWIVKENIATMKMMEETLSHVKSAQMSKNVTKFRYKEIAERGMKLDVLVVKCWWITVIPKE